jgi:hypothetical protein
MPTFFEIVGATLDSIYADFKDSDEEIKKRLNDLSDRYSHVLAKGGPSYEDELTRFAYVFRYATAHADYLNSIVGWDPELRAALRRHHRARRVALILARTA